MVFLSKEDLAFKDIKMSESTMALDNKHVCVPEDTIIPGSFKAFCKSISTTNPKYNAFAFDPRYYDVEEDDISQNEYGQSTSSPAIDNFVAVEEKIITHFSEMFHDQTSKILSLQEYFSEVIHVLIAHCATSHHSLGHILRHLEECVSSHGIPIFVMKLILILLPFLVQETTHQLSLLKIKPFYLFYVHLN